MLLVGEHHSNSWCTSGRYHRQRCGAGYCNERAARRSIIGHRASEETGILLRGDDLTEMQLVLCSRFLGWISCKLKRWRDRSGTGNYPRSSCLMTLSQVNRKSIEPDQRNITGLVNPMELNWTVESDLSSTSSSSLSTVGSPSSFHRGRKHALMVKRCVERSYSLNPESAYDLGLMIQIDNLAEQAQDLAYRLGEQTASRLRDGGTTIRSALTGAMAAARDIVARRRAAGTVLLADTNF